MNALARTTALPVVLILIELATRQPRPLVQRARGSYLATNAVAHDQSDG